MHHTAIFTTQICNKTFSSLSSHSKSGWKWRSHWTCVISCFHLLGSWNVQHNNLSLNECKYMKHIFWTADENNNNNNNLFYKFRYKLLVPQITTKVVEERPDEHENSNRRKILAASTQLKQLRKEILKKIQSWTGFEPMTSVMPVQCSTNWAVKPIGSWSYIVSS